MTRARPRGQAKAEMERAKEEPSSPPTSPVRHSSAVAALPPSPLQGSSPVLLAAAAPSLPHAADTSSSVIEPAFTSPGATVDVPPPAAATAASILAASILAAESNDVPSSFDAASPAFASDAAPATAPVSAQPMGCAGSAECDSNDLHRLVETEAESEALEAALDSDA